MHSVMVHGLCMLLLILLLSELYSASRPGLCVGIYYPKWFHMPFMWVCRLLHAGLQSDHTTGYRCKMVVVVAGAQEVVGGGSWKSFTRDNDFGQNPDWASAAVPPLLVSLSDTDLVLCDGARVAAE